MSAYSGYKCPVKLLMSNTYKSLWREKTSPFFLFLHSSLVAFLRKHNISTPYTTQNNAFKPVFIPVLNLEAFLEK